jgi:putative ABC transport system permease protein
LSDLPQAARSLKHAPAFTLVTAATLALGIGATAAIFTVVHGVLLSPLPYPNPDRIVAVTTRWTSGRQSPRVTGGDFIGIRQATPSFEALAFYHGGEVGVQLPGHADFTQVFWTTADFFRVFGVAPRGGRVFGDGENAAVVSEEFAVHHFENPTAALSQVLSVEGRSYQIVGVLPTLLHFPRRAEVWLPGGFIPSNLDRTAFNYQAVGRIRDGVSLERTQTDLETVGSRLAQAFPDSNRQKAFSAVPLREFLVGPIRPTLRLVFGGVLLLLSIACANAASLLVSRAATRTHETAIRVALGANLSRLLRQSLAESLILGLLGGAAGVMLALAASATLLRLAPFDLPRLETLHVDWTVVAFIAAVSLTTSVLFAIAPLPQARLVDIQQAVGHGSRAIGGRRVHRIRTVLLTAEIALAFALTVTAGLLVRSLRALDTVSLGYETDHRLVMYAHAPARTRDEYVQVTRVFATLLDELGHVPGVVSAAAVMGLPGGQYGSNGGYAVEGRDVFSAGRNLPEADFALASGEYFSTMGIPRIAGRDFSRADDDKALAVAIVSEALARQSFPSANPIGRRITCGLDEPRPMTIVGVVGDVRGHSPALPPGPQLYMPLAQHPYFANEVQVVLHTTMRPEAATETVRRIVRAHNPEIAMKFTTLDRTLSDSVSVPRFRAMLFGSFGSLALGLAMAGVYGLMSYLGVLRTAEFGVRIALGARPRDVVWLMLGHAARVAVAGLAVGIAAAIAIARLAGGLLFGIEPVDASAFVVAAAALTATLLAGAALPAWRAGRIDPVRAIRTE